MTDMKYKFDGITIGDKIEITAKDDAEKVYLSRAEENLTCGGLLIHLPVFCGELIKLPENQVYNMIFFTSAGLVKLDAVITGYKTDGDFYYMIINAKSEGEKIQRRNFFRLLCLLPIKYAETTDTNNRNVSDENLRDGVIKDISGGGLRFVTNCGLNENKELKCFIMLPDETGKDNTILVLQGKILHKQHFPKSNYKYQYRIQFLNISEDEREIITQYVFKEQRKSVNNSR